MRATLRTLGGRMRRQILRAAAAPLHLKHALASRGSPISANERKLLQLANRYAGRRCVIIGGGPSLKQMNLDLLSGEVTFCVNGFYHLFDSLRFIPTFYVVE